MRRDSNFCPQTVNEMLVIERSKFCFFGFWGVLGINKMVRTLKRKKKTDLKLGFHFGGNYFLFSKRNYLVFPKTIVWIDN